jgi:hypothetical protein
MDRVIRWGAGATLVLAILAGTLLPAAAQDDADLAAVRDYAIEQSTLQKAGTEQFLVIAQQYYDLAEAAGFDYTALWESNGDELTTLMADAKDAWLEASTHYEMNEGLVAGVPSLAYYDVLLDAGPSGEEDPAEALDWTLELPDGTTMEKPGNYFHHLTEPLIWGTVEDFIGLRVDFDGDGDSSLGEVLPNAGIFIATAEGLDATTAELQTAVDEWDPTIEDAFGAIVTMVPTMNEYFEQWKNSAFVAGETSTEASFGATSRLFDVNGILHGLDLTYDEIGPRVEVVNPDLHGQIVAGFDDLVTYVGDLYDQEAGGKRFTGEEAELFGTEAQEKADRLAGLVSQAVSELGLTI